MARLTQDAPYGLERAPFLEPRIEDALPAVPGARRRLGEGHPADTDLPDNQV
ncbi:hypothetical protein AB0442_32010 [Kitasatospora sp. NPDC085895]|uniref:hypothetical protein n=1 Tax=Kitasatospora sp. NPDC085895 TaxID=3155057 RepID=UPI00344B8349